MVRTRREAAKDLALYLVITVAILAPVLAAAIDDWHFHVLVRSTFAISITAIVFGPFLLKTRPHWKRARFWLGSLALFVMHCGLLAFLTRLQHVTIWTLTPVLAIESATLAFWAAELSGEKTRFP